MSEVKCASSRKRWMYPYQYRSLEIDFLLTIPSWYFAKQGGGGHICCSGESSRMCVHVSSDWYAGHAVWFVFLMYFSRNIFVFVDQLPHAVLRCNRYGQASVISVYSFRAWFIHFDLFHWMYIYNFCCSKCVRWLLYRRGLSWIFNRSIVWDERRTIVTPLLLQLFSIYCRDSRKTVSAKPFCQTCTCSSLLAMCW